MHGDEVDVAGSVGVRRSALPVELSSFVGRVPHVVRGVGLLGSSRLVTLVGPGGGGKTRLARRILAEVEPGVMGGVWWVELATVADGRDVVGALGRALGVPVPETTPAHRIAAIGAALGEGAVVVALDNCEHVVEDAAMLVDGLLRVGPHVVVLATSREQLGVEGETVWRIPPLEVPPPNTPADAVWGYEAVRLFVERAAQVGPELPATPQVAAVVAGICRTLDGMPLAVELAAARTATMPVGAILAGLDDRFRLLDGGPRSAPDRLRSMAASLEWSHALCTEAEQVCWRRLAVFVDGFDADAATRVVGFAPLGADEVAGVLGGLVHRSLVLHHPRPDGSARYSLLESMRAFARERLLESGEGREVADRHLTWAAELADRLEPATMLCDLDALDRLDREVPNLRAAISHATTPPPRGLDGLRLVGALPHFWARRGHGIGGADLGEEAVEAAEAAPEPFPPGVAGRARWAIAVARFYGGDMPAAAGLVARAAEDAAHPDAVESDPSLGGRCQYVLGGVQIFTDPAAARVPLSRALATAEETGDGWLRFECLGLLAVSHLFQHRPEEAAPFRGRYAEVAAGRPDLFGRAWVHLHSAMTAQVTGDVVGAGESFRSALELGEAAGDPLIQWYSCAGLTEVGVETGGLDMVGRAALAMNRPQMRFAAPVLAFAATLPAILDAAAGSAAAAALVEAGTAITRYTPYSGPRLVLAGARRALALGELDTAQRAASDALAVCDAVGSALAGSCRVLLARVGRETGDGDPGRLCHEGLAELVDARLLTEVPDAFALLAGIALDAGRPDEGARLLAASSSLRAGTVDPFAERFAGDRVRAAEALGEDADRVWAEGAALDVTAAVAYARRARGPRARPRSGWASLTPAEIAVVRLVAAGHTNPQIATQLFVSAGTVKTHLGHVFSKLGVASRAELAALAVRREP